MRRRAVRRASERAAVQRESKRLETPEEIEKRVTKTVDSLKEVGDSKDSGTQVARIKEDVIDFMRKQISDYSRRRAQLRAALDSRTPVIPAETIQADIAKIDARIDHRIAQVVALGGSFATHKDYDKYKATSNSWYGGTEYRLNEDYEQNRQAPQYVERLKADVARNEALIEALRGHRTTLLFPSEQSLRALGSKEAQSIHNRLKEAGTEIRRDQNALTGIYNNLMEIGPDNKVTPELAEGVEPSPDAKVWTFRLRRGVTFSNGKTLDADDVVASINHHRGAQSKSTAKGILAGVTDLRVSQARVAADGKSPMTFAVRFCWQPPTAKRPGGEGPR